MDTLLAILCLLVFVGLTWWAVDFFLFAPFRAFRRWERRQERITAAAEQVVQNAAGGRDAELDELRAKLDEVASAERIVARATGREPPGDDAPAGRPVLRLITGGAGSESPADLARPTESAPPAEPAEPDPPLSRKRDLPPGPPFPDGRYRLELPDLDGPLLTVWQRNYVRAALMKVGAEMKGKTLRELTVAEAEAIVLAMGGKPWKLYTGGRSWGQKRYR